MSRTEDAVRREFDEVVDEEPGHRVAPHEAGPAPADRRHEESVNGDKRRNTLNADDRAQQHPRRPIAPERSARTRDEDGHAPGHREFEVHQRLEHFAAEVEHALAEIEQAETREDPRHPQHRGESQHVRHVPSLGSSGPGRAVVGDRQDGPVVQQRQEHDHHRGDGVEIEHEDRQRHEQQHADGLGDAVGGVAGQTSEDEIGRASCRERV